MSIQSTSTPTTTSRPNQAAHRVRRLAVRVAISASVLAATVVSTGGMAWAYPEIGY